MINNNLLRITNIALWFAVLPIFAVAASQLTLPLPPLMAAGLTALVIGLMIGLGLRLVFRPFTVHPVNWPVWCAIATLSGALAASVFNIYLDSLTQMGAPSIAPLLAAWLSLGFTQFSLLERNLPTPKAKRVFLPPRD